MQAPDAGCERDPATPPLSNMQSFGTGHHGTALKLITPSPAAVMPQGQDVIHSTQRKQSLRHKPCHCSPTLPKTLTTTISVGCENYLTLVAVKISQTVNVTHV